MKVFSSRTVRTRSRKCLLSLTAITLLSLVAVFSSNLVAQNTTPAKPHRKVLVMVEPEYPSILKNAHFEGQVRLEATVLANGNVSHVEVKGGNPILSQYASQAVMRWKYTPGSAQTSEEVIFNFNASNR